MISEALIKEIKEESYNKGLNDAWEWVKKMYLETDCEDIREIYELDNYYGTEFGTVLKNFTPQEALAKLKAYEESPDRIKVGDVVKSKVTDCFALLVLNIHNDVFTGFDGKETHRCMLLDNFEKTGKHINLDSILEQISEV